jgi:hypothetical protein
MGAESFTPEINSEKRKSFVVVVRARVFMFGGQIEKGGHFDITLPDKKEK